MSANPIADPIQAFLDQYHVSPQSACAAVEVLPAVRQFIPQSKRRYWTRRKILQSLAERGYPAAMGPDKRVVVVGVSVYEPKRWTIIDGRAVQV